MYQHLIAAAPSGPLPPVEAELLGAGAVIAVVAIIYFAIKAIFN